MTKSLDKVLQSDGSYKWEMVEFQPESTEETTEITEEPKKKASKKKSTNILSE
tara:strand:+ start:361 stop:519 length:159 start_codon:yes stop_codon:yes gene_type:complete